MAPCGLELFFFFAACNLKVQNLNLVSSTGKKNNFIHCLNTLGRGKGLIVFTEL